MSLHIYAGVVDLDTKVVDHCADLTCADMYRDDGSLNPEFIPGISMDIESSGYSAMLDTIGLHDLESADMSDVMHRCVTALRLGRCADERAVLRLVQLINICQIGITSGADQLFVI